METNRQEIDRLYTAISELRKLILERADRLQAELDDGFKEIRREASINQRWMIGLTLVNTTMVLGLGGKLFGLY